MKPLVTMITALLIAATGPVQAHFLELIPSTDIVTADTGTTIKFN